MGRRERLLSPEHLRNWLFWKPIDGLYDVWPYIVVPVILFSRHCWPKRFSIKDRGLWCRPPRPRDQSTHCVWVLFSQFSVFYFFLAQLQAQSVAGLRNLDDVPLFGPLHWAVALSAARTVRTFLDKYTYSECILYELALFIWSASKMHLMV